MEQNQSQRRSRQKRKRSFLGRFFTFLIICLVLLVGISMFFRVNEIFVTGETRYTAQEVIDASGITSGDHLLFVSNETVGRAIQAELPYIGHVELRRRFPDRLEITVEETLPMARMQAGNGYFVLDRDAKVLEWLDDAPAMGLIDITGLPEPISLRTGETLTLDETEQDHVRYLQNILSMVSTLGLTDQISHVDMTEIHDPTLLYDGRFIVRLGPNLNLHHKMDMLAGIIAYMGEDESGTIDLSLDRPSFRPHEVGSQ